MKPCPPGFQKIPVKFQKNEVSDNSKFGKHLLKILHKNNRILRDNPLKEMTKYDLLQHVILDDEVDIELFLNNLPNQSERGSIYEAFWDIVITLGGLGDTLETFHSVTGKIENMEGLSTIDNVEEYFKRSKAISASSSGVSDITLKEKRANADDKEWACQKLFSNQQTDNFILFSVKYFVKERDVTDYDIENIVLSMEATNRKRKEPYGYKIVLLVKNAAEVKKKLDRSNKPIVQDVHAVYDLSDLLEIIKKVRIKNLKSPILTSIQQTKNVSLSPRFHQLLFVNKTLDIIFLHEYAERVNSRTKGDYSAVEFCVVLKYLRKVFLEDGVFKRERFRTFPAYQHHVFRSRGLLAYCLEAQTSVEIKEQLWLKRDGDVLSELQKIRETLEAKCAVSNEVGVLGEQLVCLID